MSKSTKWTYGDKESKLETVNFLLQVPALLEFLLWLDSSMVYDTKCKPNKPFFFHQGAIENEVENIYSTFIRYVLLFVTLNLDS